MPSDERSNQEGIEGNSDGFPGTLKDKKHQSVFFIFVDLT